MKTKTKKRKRSKKYQRGKGNNQHTYRNQCKLEVKYNNILINGQEMIKNKTQKRPEILFRMENGVKYIVVMWDPDAPQSSWLHWIESMKKENGILQTKIVKDYEGPNPPSGTHHYYFSLYRKENGEEIEGVPEERGYFDINRFVEENKLIKECEVYMTVSKN
jgi:phosphatidylethanolamine-binding protein (PEBP) family uncharacterized protein